MEPRYPRNLDEKCNTTSHLGGGGFGICTFIYLHRHSDFTEIAEETFDKFILLITNI